MYFYLQYCNGGDLADYLGGKDSYVWNTLLLSSGVSSENFSVIPECVFIYCSDGDPEWGHN